MPLLINTNSTRPNRLSDVKDEAYHIRYGRWTLNALNNPIYRRFITKCLINWSFYKGGDGQWIFDEDLESFFLDESGDIRNRLKITRNLIRPMVEQYIGNSIRLSINARAESTSDFAINRRELELNRMKFAYEVSKQYPILSDIIKDNIPIGDDLASTIELFDSSFVDEHEEVVNALMRFIEKDINLEQIKVMLSRYLAICGMCVYLGEERNGVYVGDYIDPMYFYWDLSAKKQDISDSEFMGNWGYMDAPSLFETYQNLTKEQRQLIEKYSVNQGLEIHRLINDYYQNAGAKIPVYKSYWRDLERQEYAWVNDHFGYPLFTRVGKDTDYSYNDVIEPPNESHKKLLNGKKRAKIFVDVLRYVVFTPKEEIGSNGEDIVYEYGEVPYQEQYTIDPSNVSFPYKVQTWAYDKGEVLSPIDDAIQPQRFINRIISVAESHINNSRGTGTVVSKDAVDPRDGEEGLTRDINKSKPIYVDTTRVGSVANAIGTYGANINSGTTILFNIVKELEMGLQNTTGINEAMTGTTGGSDALVGVVQAQIQRGSLIQEPFYYALADVVNQIYRHFASTGKRIYADNPRRLAIAVGDKGMQEILITKDIMLDDFRIFINRRESDESAISAGNALLFTLRQAGLIDDLRFAKLFNSATSEEIAKSLREFHMEKEQAKREMDDAQAKQQVEQQQQMAMLADQMGRQQAQQRQDEVDDKKEEYNNDMDKVLIKELAKNQREKMKYVAQGMPKEKLDEL